MKVLSGSSIKIMIIALCLILLSAESAFACLSGRLYPLIPSWIIFTVFGLLVIDIIFVSDKFYKSFLILPVAYLTYFVTTLTSVERQISDVYPDIYILFNIIPVFFIATIIFTLKCKNAKRKKISMCFLASLFILSSIFIGIIGGPYNLIASGGNSICWRDMRGIENSLMMYYTDNSEYYPDSLDKLIPEYDKDDMRFYCFPKINNWLAEEMFRKKHNLDFSKYKYEVSDDRKDYTIWCTSKNHQDYPNFQKCIGTKTF